MERVIAELAAVAFSDVRALFEDNGDLKPVHMLSETVAKAIASVEVTKQRTRRDGEVTTEEWVSKVRQWDKLRALELIAKLQGMFPSEKHDHKHSADESFAALVKAAAEARA